MNLGRRPWSGSWATRIRKRCLYILRFNPRPDMWTDNELSLATRRGHLDNIVFAIDHFEWFLHPDLVEDVAAFGALDLVRNLLDRGLFCSTAVMDTAAFYGFLGSSSTSM